MKNVFFLFLFMLFFLNANLAQVSKGGFLLGGGISYSGKLGKSKSTSSLADRKTVERKGPNQVIWSVRSDFKYLIKDQIGIGLSFGYSKERFEEAVLSQSSTGLGIEPDSETTTQYFIRPYLTYFAPFKNNRCGFLMDMYLHAGKGEIVFKEDAPFSTSDETKINLNDYGLGIDPGLYFFFTPTLMVDFTIGGLNYHFTRKEQELQFSSENVVVLVEKSSNIDFFFSEGLKTTLGVNFFFGRKND